MKTRSYRANRLAREMELYESRARRATNEAAVAGAYAQRNAPGIAPIEPATLMRLFFDPAQREAAWAQLAKLSDDQLLNQAIETTCYLEGMGMDVRWGNVLQRWQQKLGRQV